MNNHNFEFVEKFIRKMTFGILSTVDGFGKPHSTGMLYSVSSPKSKFSIFCTTSEKTKKSKNIRENPHVAFVIPFPHHVLRSVPSSCIQIQGTAEILSLDDNDARLTFQRNKTLKSNFKQVDDSKNNMVFIKITPDEKIHCFGVGIKLMELKRDHAAGNYSVVIPSNRK